MRLGPSVVRLAFFVNNCDLLPVGKHLSFNSCVLSQLHIAVTFYDISCLWQDYIGPAHHIEVRENCVVLVEGRHHLSLGNFVVPPCGVARKIV